MKCVICKHGETEAGVVTVSLERDETTVMVKGVLAQVCDNCAEYYVSEDVTAKVLGLAEDAAKKQVEVEIFRYAA